VYSKSKSALRKRRSWDYHQRSGLSPNLQARHGRKAIINAVPIDQCYGVLNQPLA